MSERRKSMSKKKKKKKRLLRGYCAIIPNTTTKTRTNCLHMSGIFFFLLMTFFKASTHSEMKTIFPDHYYVYPSQGQKFKKKKRKKVFWYFAPQNRLLFCRVSRQRCSKSRGWWYHFQTCTLEFKKKKGKNLFWCWVGYLTVKLLDGMIRLASFSRGWTLVMPWYISFFHGFKSYMPDFIPPKLCDHYRV